MLKPGDLRKSHNKEDGGPVDTALTWFVKILQIWKISVRGKVNHSKDWDSWLVLLGHDSSFMLRNGGKTGVYCFFIESCFSVWTELYHSAFYRADDSMRDKRAIQRPYSMPMTEPYRLLHECIWYLQRQIYRPYWKQRVSSPLAFVGKAGWDTDAQWAGYTPSSTYAQIWVLEHGAKELSR